VLAIVQRFGSTASVSQETDHDTPEQLDFDAIEERLREQSEQYRERHLIVKLSLYGRFFAFEGRAQAAAVVTL
jgi:hypothetical protein